MDRRSFFRKSLLGLRDSAVRAAPETVRKQLGHTALDISILTSSPDAADALCGELLGAHAGAPLLRLRRAQLAGDFPGGMLLFENNRRVNFHDGVSLLYAALRQIELELHVHELQAHPTLVRFTNVTPPFSRSVEVWHRERLALALPLNEPGIFTCEGSLGPLVFEIRDGRFRVTEAPCLRGICKAHPPIIAPGERITCAPSEVTAVIGPGLGA